MSSIEKNEIFIDMDLRESNALNSKVVSRHPWELARLEVVYDIFSKNMPPVENSTIIDIGCGDTFFVERFSEHFPSVNFIAVDTAFSAQMISNYQRKLQEKKIQLFDSLDKAQGAITSPVSAVFLFDVVEHIEYDHAFLKDLASRKFMNAETRLLITVPAFQPLFTSHDVFLGHFRRYNNASLKSLMNESGFTALKTGYFFTSLIAPRIIQLLKEKMFGRPEAPSTDLVEWKGGNFITSLLKNVLMVDYKIGSLIKKAGINIPGLSNYTICKKSA